MAEEKQATNNEVAPANIQANALNVSDYVASVENFDHIKLTKIFLTYYAANGSLEPNTIEIPCIGLLEVETEMSEFSKNCGNEQIYSYTKPIYQTVSFTGHVPLAVYRRIYGISNKGLVPGVYSYGTKSIAGKFVLTGEIYDEYQDQTKLIAFPHGRTTEGMTFSIDNTADELAEMEFEFRANKDDYGQTYYEAMVSELEPEDAAFFREEWHRAFRPTFFRA